MIQLKDVSKKFKQHDVLRQINLNINRGRVYGFQGINGSGKTMLLRAILGLIRIDGTLLVRGQALKFGQKYPLEAGIFIEKPSILLEFSAMKNMKLMAALKPQATTDECQHYLKRFYLNPDDKRKVKTYSLGMKQKLGLAQAFIGKPELIVLDEPTNALDKKSISVLCDVIKEHKQRGASILIASHQIDALAGVIDETYTLEHGVLL